MTYRMRMMAIMMGLASLTTFLPAITQARGVSGDSIISQVMQQVQNFTLSMSVSRDGKGQQEYQFRAYQYGPAEKQVFYMVHPMGLSKPEKLAILVHGGGFLSGSALGFDVQPLAHYFLNRGYTVASVDYRTLTGSSWPTPVQDIAEGIHAVYRQFAQPPEESVLVGFSAGAVSGALLLYGQNYPPLPEIDKFIGISGLYSKAATAEAPIRDIRIQSLKQENLLEIVDDIRRPSTKTPALLIQGTRDYFADRYPGTSKSHASYLSALLNEHQIHSKVYWARQEGYDDHVGPISLITLGHPEMIQTMDRFLASQDGHPGFTWFWK